MKHPFLIPALADLREDIAGPIPVDLIKAWIESDRTPEAHAKLLAPFTRHGTVVKTDSAGLSKLSRARPLLEVLKLVNEPKEIIAAHGLAVGGEAIGVWIADDTQMFYDDAIPTERVVDAMVSAQIANTNNHVQVGMAIHRGEFFHIGGGLYGEDADLVEELGENKTEGGEILIVEPRESLDYTGREATVKPLRDFEYPAPFSKKFLAMLRSYDAGENESFADEYAKEASIVLVRVFHESQALLLDQLVAHVAASSKLSGLLSDHNVTKVKCNGALGIFHCDTDAQAQDFALAARETLRDAGFEANVGVTRGTVFLFPLENGGKEIAGSPVNLASKLAEDTEERNVVFIHDSCALHPTHQVEPFTITPSGVELKGWKA
jgi:class 3 adenylate cyclase